MKLSFKGDLKSLFDNFERERSRPIFTVVTDLGLPLEVHNLLPCKGCLDTNGQPEGIIEHCSCMFPLKQGYSLWVFLLVLISDVFRMHFMVLA